jgi:hypothetical protein
VAAAPAAGACGPPKGDVASHQLDADAEQLAGDGGEDAAAADAAAADAAAAAADHQALGDRGSARGVRCRQLAGRSRGGGSDGRDAWRQQRGGV